MDDSLKTTDFSKLPNWVRFQIKEIGISNPEEWIHHRIPALNNQSVLEVIYLPDGEKLLRDYFSKVKGKF